MLKILSESRSPPDGDKTNGFGCASACGARRTRRCAYTPACAHARSRRVAAAAARPYLRSMNGTRNDVDPASELLEEDEEQTLPESEQDIDLAAAGPLAVGRAVIANHAKLAPSSPGVYRMIDAKEIGRASCR